MEGSEKLTEAEGEGTGGDYAFMLSVRQGKDGGIFFARRRRKTVCTCEVRLRSLCLCAAQCAGASHHSDR